MPQPWVITGSAGHESRCFSIPSRRWSDPTGVHLDPPVIHRGSTEASQKPIPPRGESRCLGASLRPSEMPLRDAEIYPGTPSGCGGG